MVEKTCVMTENVPVTVRNELKLSQWFAGCSEVSLDPLHPPGVSCSPTPLPDSSVDTAAVCDVSFMTRLARKMSSDRTCCLTFSYPVRRPQSVTRLEKMNAFPTK